MSAEWIQFAVVALIVAGSSAYLVRTMWKSARAKSGGGCHGGCHCESGPPKSRS